MEVSIRPARVDDAASIVALLNPIIDAGTYTAMEGPITIEDQVAFIRDFPARGVFNVAATGDGSIVGCQDIIPDGNAPVVGEISTFVSLDALRQGIGSTMMRATLDEAATRGFRTVLATIRANNPSAVAFYRNQGFEERRNRKTANVLLERCLQK